MSYSRENPEDGEILFRDNVGVVFEGVVNRCRVIK